MVIFKLCACENIYYNVISDELILVGGTRQSSKLEIVSVRVGKQ